MFVTRMLDDEEYQNSIVSVSLKVTTDSQEKCFHYIAN